MREEAGWHQRGHSGMRGGGRGTWKEGGVLAFLRERSLQGVSRQVSIIQVYTGRRLPQQSLSSPSAAYVCKAEPSAPPPLPDER